MSFDADTVQAQVAIDLQAEFFEIVDKFQYRLEQTLSEQIKRADVLLWMRRAPLHMAIRVQIPADITKECRVQKCASKDFINHVKFNRSMNAALGISAQDMMKGVGFRSIDLAKGSIYHRRDEVGPWDPAKVDRVNARATALKFVVGDLGYTAMDSGCYNFFCCNGTDIKIAPRSNGPEHSVFYGDCVFFGSVTICGYVGSSISIANAKLVKDGIQWSGEAIRKQKRGEQLTVMQQLGKENEIEKELVKLFSQYDTDGDGFIDQNELAAMMIEMHINQDSKKLDESLEAKKTDKEPDIELAKEVLDALDADKSGTLERDEFVGWLMTGLRQTKDTLKHFSSRGHQYKVLHNFLAAVVAEILPNLQKGENKTVVTDVKNVDNEQQNLSLLKPDLQELVKDGIVSYTEALEMMDEASQASDAASKIQAIQRGRIARKDFEEKKEAAIKIQALQRGKVDREKVKKMSQQGEESDIKSKS